MGTTEDDEEAYSPSGSLTPPPGTESSFLDKSSNISLPSDLQEIISSLKKKPEEPRSLDLDSDPIVQAYKTSNEPYSPEEDKEDQSEPETAPEPPTVQSAPSVKVNRDPRQRPAQTALSQLSDEEIIRKASEMGYMNPENPEPIPDVSRSRISAERPPGVDEEYNPFEAEHPVLQHPLMAMPIDSGVPFAPSMPPPHLPPFLPPNQFQPPPMFPPPMQSLHIPFTNPQPPPPQPLYPPPPPPQPAPLPPPPPSKSPERDFDYPRRRYSKKSKKESRETKSRKKKKRRYSESPPPKTKYNEKYERSRDRYSKKEKREKRETKEIWKSYGDSKEIPERKREPSWEYEEEPPMHLPPPMLPGPPPGPSQGFGIRGPMRGGPGPMRGGPNRGRFQRGMRGGFRGNFRGGPPMRGFHRGGFHQRGHPVGSGPPPGPSRNFQPPEPAFQNEYEEDIRRFEEQRLKEKNLERRKWRKESPPRKRRGKDDSD